MDETLYPESPLQDVQVPEIKPDREFAIAFTGDGMELFKIQIVNLILTIVTLGLYYPWAKARTLNYLYSKSTLEADAFAFSGTGQEMFKGFIKALIILGAVLGIFYYLYFEGYLLPAFLFYLVALAGIAPLAIHGSMRYRAAKSSWRGIRFGYTGNRNDFVILFFKWILYTIFSFGLYQSWFTTNMRKYIISHLKMGNAEFEFRGEGHDYFVINLKGYFLTLLSLGLYSFWWQKDRFEFMVDNIRLKHHEDAVVFRSNATGGDFLGLMIINFLIIIFTLGLGYPWVIVRTLQFGCRHIELTGNISLEDLQQEQGDYSDATGADMGDLLDFGFTI